MAGGGSGDGGHSAVASGPQCLLPPSSDCLCSIRLSAPGCGPPIHAALVYHRRATAAESDDEADSRANSEDWEEAPSQIQLAQVRQVTLPAGQMLTWQLGCTWRIASLRPL